MKHLYAFIVWLSSGKKIKSNLVLEKDDYIVLLLYLFLILLLLVTCVIILGFYGILIWILLISLASMISRLI